MERLVRIAAALSTCAALSCCAAPRHEAKREEPPGLSVRLPIADASMLRIESQPSPGRQEVPLSVADESRGRWLTLFEMNYTPAKPPLPLLPVIEEGSTR